MKKSRQQGSALILSLITLALTSLLAVSGYRIMKVVLFESVMQERLAQAQFIAEAGIEDALLQLYLNPDWRAGFNKKPFGGGNYTVTLTSDSSPWIESRAASASLSFLGPVYARVRVQAEVAEDEEKSDDCQTMADHHLEINGTMNAYDSSLSVNPGAFTFGGRLCSNQRVIVDTGSGIRVRADVEYFQGPAPSASTIEGTITRSTFTRAVSVVNGNAYALVNSNLTISPISAYNILSRRLTVNSGQTVTMRAGTYYLNDMTINGTLNVDTSGGPVTIYLVGFLTVSTSGRILNSGRVPSQLRIYSQVSEAIDLRSHTSDVHAVIHAPLADVTVRRELFGNIICDRLYVTSTGALHYDVRAGSSVGSTGGTSVPTRTVAKAGTWSIIP